MPPFHRSPPAWQLTCTHHPCKHPALAVLDRPVVVLTPLLEDHHAAIPPGWVLMRVETPLPLAQENSVVVIVPIDLKRGQWTECTEWTVCNALCPARSVALGAGGESLVLFAHSCGVGAKLSISYHRADYSAHVFGISSPGHIHGWVLAVVQAQIKHGETDV